jgi:hypothetical protein
MPVTTTAFAAVMVISIVSAAAHWPASGVKIYACVPTTAVLITLDGLHEPVIPLHDVDGKLAAVVPSQYVVVIHDKFVGASGVTVTVTLSTQLKP